MSMLLRHSFGYTLTESGMLIAVSAFTSTIIGVFLGFITDRSEKRGWSCFIGLLVTSVSYLGLIFAVNNKLTDPLEAKYLVLAPLFFN